MLPTSFLSASLLHPWLFWFLFYADLRLMPQCHPSVHCSLSKWCSSSEGLWQIRLRVKTTLDHEEWKNKQNRLCGLCRNVHLCYITCSLKVMCATKRDFVFIGFQWTSSVIITIQFDCDGLLGACEGIPARLHPLNWIQLRQKSTISLPPPLFSAATASLPDDLWWCPWSILCYLWHQNNVALQGFCYS